MSMIVEVIGVPPFQSCWWLHTGMHLSKFIESCIEKGWLLLYVNLTSKSDGYSLFPHRGLRRCISISYTVKETGFRRRVAYRSGYLTQRHIICVSDKVPRKALLGSFTYLVTFSFLSHPSLPPLAAGRDARPQRCSEPFVGEVVARAWAVVTVVFRKSVVFCWNK